MASIENKVVTMNFNNGEFEKNISTSMGSLANLQKSLDFKDAGKSFAGITKAADGVKLDGIASAVQNIESKFSAMSVVAITAIANITSKAVDAGLQIVKSFTIAPIGQGFAEFELKMGSIQTIMAGSGESLETVNQKLQDLNAYSDRTIYSFKDMTSNIGKFTNAGVSLDASVASIQGIANVAALSGANAEEASRAMYNFAQSLSSGSVKLMDWKSIELANMATVEFKTQLLESAVAAGTLNKDAEGLYTTLEGTPVSATKGFNESLEQQWLTSQALTETLARYSDTTTDIGARATAAAQDVKTFSQMMDTLRESAASGWAQTSELIFGDFEEGKKLWTGINNSVSGMLSSSADARNAVISVWKNGGGRALLIESLGQAIQNLGQIVRPIKEAFREFFPATTGRDLLSLTVSFSKFVEALTPSPKLVGVIRNVFKALFGALRIGYEVIKGVAGVFIDLFGVFAGAGGGKISAFIGSLANKIYLLEKALLDGKIPEFFDKISKSITDFVKGIDLSPVADAFNFLVDQAKRFIAFFTSGFSGVDGTMGFMADRLGGVAKVAYEVGQAIGSIATTVKKFFGSLDFSAVGTAIDTLKSAFAALFGGSDGEEGIVPAAAGESVSRFAAVLSALGGVASAVASAIGKALSVVGSIGQLLGKVVAEIAKGLADVWDAVASALSSGNAPDMNKIFAVLGAGLLGGLTAALLKFAKDGFKFDFGQFAMFEEIGKSLDSIRGVMSAMQKDIIAGALVKIAIAIGVLTLSLIALSFVDGVTLAKSMTGVAVGLGLLVGAMVGLDKIASGEGQAVKIALLAVSMTAIAGAMLLLAIAVRLMATTDPVAMSIGLLGMLAALEMMSRVMKKLSEDTDGIVKAAFAVGVLSVSLLLFSLAIRSMMSIDMLDMSVGIFAISAALTIISQTMGSMPSDGMVKAALSIGILSLALIILAFSIKQMSDIGLVDTATGLGAMAISLKIIGDVLKEMAGPDILKAGAAMLLMSFGVRNLASGIERLGGIDLWTLVKGLSAMVIIFKVLGASMDSAKQSLGGGAALLLISLAIYGFAMAVEKMAAIPFMDLIKGLGAVVIAMVVLAGTSYVLAAAVPILAALGAGLALIGLAAAGFGAGIFLIARGMEILAKVGPEGVSVFLGSLDSLLGILPRVAIALGKAAFDFVTSFLSGFDTLIPLVIDLLGKLLDAIQELAPKIFKTARMLIKEFLKGVASTYKEIVKTGLSMITSLLTGIRDNIGPMALLAIEIVTNFIKAMAAGIPGYVTAMVDLWVTVLTTMVKELGTLIVSLAPTLGIAFAEGILQGIKDTISKVKDFFGEWAGQILDFIKGLFGIQSPSKSFAEIGVNLILGLLEGIVNTIGEIKTFFTELGKDILDWIGNMLVLLITKGANLITGLKTGITNTIGTISSWASGLASSVVTWIGSTIFTLVQIGRDFIIGLLNGAKAVWETVRTWAEGLTERIKGYISSPATLLLSVGKDIVRGLWDGIVAMKDWLMNRIKDMAGWMPGWAKKFLNIESPSKVFAEIGKFIPMGLGVGVDNGSMYIKDAMYDMADKTIQALDDSGLNDGLQDSFNKAFEEIVANMGDMNGMNPTITPVLDLTGVQKDARALNGMFGNADISGNYAAASLISAATLNRQNGSENSELGVGDGAVNFVQNNYSPTALSTTDIYRNTRSQFALVKEELNIP